MQKENGKREPPYKGILRFAKEKKSQLAFAVVLSVLSSAFGVVPYIAVAILLQKALENSLTTTWAILLPVIALCGYLLKHALYAKSTLCSHKAAYEIIKNIRTAIMKKMSKVSMGTIQGKSSGEFKQLVIDDAERLEGPLAHAIPEMTASTLVPIFVILYLVMIDWRMALAALISAVLGNIKEINVGGGGNNFDIADKITVSEFRQEQTGEHKKPEIEAQPEVKIKKPKPASVEEEQKKRLSQIIDEVNALYDKKYGTDFATKSAMQIRDLLLQNPEFKDRLTKSAKNNSLDDFKFTYDDCIQDALVEGYDQNADFYTLLLNNEEVRARIASVFMSEIYRILRGEDK